MDTAAVIGVVVWVVLVALVSWDERRREVKRPLEDDAEARRAFDERMAREQCGRDA